MRRVIPLFMAVLWLFAFNTNASAHSQSYGYLQADLKGEAATGSLALAVRDLDLLYALDTNGDGQITWGEVRQREAEISRTTLSQIAIGACVLEGGPLLTDSRGGEAYLVMPFSGRCPAAGGETKVSYNLLFAQDAQHRGLVTLTMDGGARSFVVTPETREFTVSAGSGMAEVVAFVSHGMHHIWAGYDHILFLITLLLGAVHLAGAREFWVPFVDAVKVVTAFTLSHSVTLGLAATGLLKIPVPVAESLIAATIVLAAINNMWPFMTRRIWLLALVFGLIHGVGFANVLADIGLPQTGLLTALLAFNIGVELGQLAILVAVFPLVVLALRMMKGNLPARVANAAIAVIGALWFSDRVFGTALMWF